MRAFSVMTSKGGLIGHRKWAYLLVAALLQFGCGDEKPAASTSPTGDVVQDGTDPDIFVQNDNGLQVDVDIVDTGADVIAILDISQDATATVDAGPQCPGAAGCPCTTTNDCTSGFCLDTPNGQQCAQPCPTGECPSEYKCSTVPLPGGDSANICVPALGKLCNPCTANTQCQGPGNGGARCIDTGNGGAFCGVQCNAQADCPNGYVCKDAEDLTGSLSKQCVITSGVCPCTKAAIANEAYTVCYKDTGSAQCAGKRICLADGKAGAPTGGGLSACLADEPEAESCDGKDNDCDGQVDELSCEDNNPCTDDTCDPKAGCSHTNNAGFCDADGNVCTKDDACSNGKCLTGQPIKCDDNNPCTTDSCDAKAGCKNEAAEGLGCNYDDNPCTVGDSCKVGKCEAGPKKACASDDQCVEGKCDIIQDGKCVYKNKASPCSDGDLCTESDLCAASDGTCSGKLVNCDDLNPCTADKCDKTLGCTHNNAAGICDDGDKCTITDTCSNGKCDGKSIDASSYCNDNNVCTNDSCNPALGCVNKVALGVQCEDGNSCSVGDKCDDKGQCVPGSNSCACDNDAQCESKDDGNLCNGTLFCDKSTSLSQCKVKPGSSITCNTSNDNSCSKTVCEPATGKCVAQIQPTGLPCDADKSVCTVDDGCKAGQCAPGKSLPCDDKNSCTLDTCDSATGCQYTPTGGACDADGDACTQSDSCAAGKCEAGAKKTCADGEACTDDSCNKTTGACEFKPVSQGCSDLSECTIGDACGTDPKTGKYTCLAGKGPNCDDANPCTLDTCEIVSGCKNAIDAKIKVPCYSGAPKTDGVGLCKAGTQACDSNGVLGACTGEVVPEKTDPCDGKDNDCNGIADPGCAPTAFSARFATADVRGKSSDGKSIAVVAGASNVSGLSSGVLWNVKFGFVAWLKGLFGI